MTAPWTLYTDRQRWTFLGILFLVSTSSYFDRNVISILFEPIKHEFQISDTMLGLLGGFCFSLFYAVAGIPIARWADRGNRRTIIALAIAMWSVMTAFCGMAQTFWQLALARVGVGAGEAGSMPPAQSLIADYFPPDRRATAIAIFIGAATAGNLLGLGLGGYLASEYGWRSAFLGAAAPGLVLAVIVRIFLAEPRRQIGLPGTAAQEEKLGKAMRKLRAKPSYLLALVGMNLYFLFAYGGHIFVPSFLIRILHVPLAEASSTYGTLSAIASVVGTVGGGWLTDYLARRDIRWLAWLPALVFFLTGPVYIIAFLLDDFWIFLGLASLAYMLVTAGIPAGFTTVHAICGSSRRSMAIAIVLFSATLFGGGVGPLLTGMVSDAFNPTFGAESLRYALIVMTPVVMASGVIFYLCGLRMPADLED